MEYAIVDIETTGSYAAGNAITEIAIHIHDGMKVIHRYETLVKPGRPIPVPIQAFTGITDEMVNNAPDFSQIAPQVYQLLHERVFVAHHVNFDYSFVRHHLEACGYELKCPKLCTVRLSRKLFPGLPSYSLGRLCQSLEIPLHDRHRAGGDVAATALLFSKLLARDAEDFVNSSLKRGTKEQQLPAHLPANSIDQLPTKAGVYFFLDEKGKVLYIGKAKNIRQRVNSHFTGTNHSAQRQQFLRHIHHIEHQECGTELMAFILEFSEIKKKWPPYNRALKRFEQKYALYAFEDQNGYLRLAIDKYRANGEAQLCFQQLLDGYQLLRKLVSTYQLCEKLCYIQKGNAACTQVPSQACKGACTGEEAPETYNFRVNLALNALEESLPSFMIIDQGRHAQEKSCIWVEKGKLIGMGYLPDHQPITQYEELKPFLKPYPSNDYLLHLLLQHHEKFPSKSYPIGNTP